MSPRKNLQAKRRRQRRMRIYIDLRSRYISHKPWRCKILPPNEHHMWTPEGNITFPINPPTPAAQEPSR